MEFGAVVNTATDSSVCTVTGTTVTLMDTGTCTIVASQGGNVNVRAAANVSQSFTVTPGALIVTIVSPVNNQQLTTPANLTIVATVLERGGTIARVVFYNGSTVLGTVTEPGLQPASQPASQTGSQASITLPDVAIGSYKLTARATDGTGKTVTSSAVAVSVVAGMPTTKGDGEMHYIVTDQLGTPRQVMDSKGVTVWQWDGEAFGNTPPNANPGGQGDFVFNLRFPGQYFDAETNMNQNYYRDYDLATGRYLQSDPIGLSGGINSYLYVGGNPVSRIDALGLDWIWQQSSGNLYNTPIGGMGPPYLVSPGGSGQYSGQNLGLNNPANQSVPGTGPDSNGGPLPQGTYDIGFGHYSSGTGPNTMNLTPQTGTDTLGRDLFRIHGDNSAQNNTASEGCIVAGSNVRTKINNSIDRVLRVVP